MNIYIYIYIYKYKAIYNSISLAILSRIIYSVYKYIMYLDKVGKLSAHLEQFLLEFSASP